MGHFKGQIAAWLRELTTHFAPSLLPAWRLLRWKGIYMCVCAWPLRRVPFAIDVEGMGHFSTRIEFCSFLDNFCGEELKCPEVEHALTTESSPLVVDIGINIGFTVRHWYCLNPSARVIGLDMMEECIAYTTEQLKRIRPKASWHPICGAVTDGAGEMELAFDDPLSGTNSITAAGGHLKRKVPANTLDHWIQDCGNQEITLLKIDVEDHGVSVLKGATQVLSRARYLALEIHSDSELEGCAQLLFHAGWIPFSKARRNTWWRKPQQAVTHSPA